MAATDALAGEAATDNGGAVTKVKMAEMPVELLRWVLAQDKEDYRVPTLEDYTQEELAEAKDHLSNEGNAPMRGRHHRRQGNLRISTELTPYQISLQPY
jgi:hypothetical protein